MELCFKLQHYTLGSYYLPEVAIEKKQVAADCHRSLVGEFDAAPEVHPCNLCVAASADTISDCSLNAFKSAILGQKLGSLLWN